MSGYGQFCPVAKAMELLDERWTLLVVRELLMGSRHFNDLRRGVPRMSPALLAKRLRTLQRAGVVERREYGGRASYVLTEAGQELRPVVEALGRWGTRWVPELGEADLDPHLLVWDIHRNLDLEAMPEGRTVIHLRFLEVPVAVSRWWVVVDEEGVDVCDADPGHPVALTMTSSLRTLTELWRGAMSWSQAVGAGLQLDGPSWAQHSAPRWLRLSAFADTPRPAASAIRAGRSRPADRGWTGSPPPTGNRRGPAA